MKSSAGISNSPGATAGAASWATHRERGSVFWLRVMSWISLRLGRRASRVITYCIAAYFLVFAPRARRHARDYLRRVLGRPATALDRFRQIFTFASTIHDRVFFLNGRFELFDVSIDGEAIACATRTSDGGALLMGAHLGSFEVTRALGRRLPDQQIAMAMYADNARKINAALTAISPRLKTDIIALGPLSALLEIRARLAAGSFVGMMGDRALGAEPVERVMFLGAPAAFPLGPFRVAAKLRRPVCFMAGFYLGNNRYHVVFEQIADFSATESDGEAAAVREALQRYVAVVERYCRKYPYNWFNFLDFWGELS
ncbi:MAG: acyl-CoA synthetase [Steroidobacteraceae bacterium]